MVAPGDWEAQPVFGYQRFALPQVHPQSRPVDVDTTPPMRPAPMPRFAFPPPPYPAMTPDETGMGFANTRGKTTAFTGGTQGSALSRMPSALLLSIGVFVGVLGAFGILSTVTPDKMAPRAATTFVQDAPRRAILFKPAAVSTHVISQDAGSSRRQTASRGRRH